MNLYIQVQDGQCVNHPALEENLIQAFGKVPDNWELFVRVQPVLPDEYHVLASQEPTYQKINGAWIDVWDIREMTLEEREQVDFAKQIAKEREERIIEKIKEDWAARSYASNFAAWVFDELQKKFVPPFPRPDDGKFYRWHGPSNNWREAEPFPNDGKKYEFDFDNWVNVEKPDV